LFKTCDLDGKEIEVIFQPDGKRSRVKSGTNVLEAAKLVGADLASICGGKSICGKCRIIIKGNRGSVGPPTSIEKSLISEEDLSEGYRLACQTPVFSNVTVKIPKNSRTGQQRLQIEGIETPTTLEPSVEKYFLELPKPSLQDPKADAERLLGELQIQKGLINLRIDPSVLQSLPSILRSDDWKVTVVLLQGETVIAVEAGDTTNRIFGYVLDIGTTKLAAYLLDLKSGKVVAVTSSMNPQIHYGEDVIARITYTMKGSKEKFELHQVIINSANELLKQLVERTGVKNDEVYEAIVVGNTVMHHLFLNIDPQFLGLSPYTPAVRRGIDVKSSSIGMNINPHGNVYTLPVIAGFVGADTVADILATETHKRSELCLAFDIGTNTEVFLGNKDEILACSCASGPALEGAHVKHGMRAATGAIEKVTIDPDTFAVQYWTVDNTKPCGICGSAMVDILAEMLKAGVIDVSGKMKRNITSERLRTVSTGVEFVLAYKDETATAEDITFSQKDVREIQLAKAAIHTGTVTLMKKKGVNEADVDIVFIAGAFGSYIDPENARIIGMYPEIPLERVRVIGNAAGTGGRMALVSKASIAEAEQISRKVKYVELAAEASFQAEYLNSFALPYADLSKYPETSELLKSLGKYPEKPPFYFTI